MQSLPPLTSGPGLHAKVMTSPSVSMRDSDAACSLIAPTSSGSGSITGTPLSRRSPLPRTAPTPPQMLLILLLPVELPVPAPVSRIG